MSSRPMHMMIAVISGLLMGSASIPLPPRATAEEPTALFQEYDLATNCYHQPTITTTATDAIAVGYALNTTACPELHHQSAPFYQVLSTNNGISFAEPISRTTGATIATRLHYGQHAGRLVRGIPVSGPRGSAYTAILFSDDHGSSWITSNWRDAQLTDLSIIELSDGTLMADGASPNGTRQTAYSYDSGLNWSTPVTDTTTPIPHREGAMIRAYPQAPPQSVQAKILVATDTETIRVSCDEGRTWPVEKQLMRKYIRHPQLAALSNDLIGLAYEIDNNISFARFNLAWLGRTCLTATAPITAIAAGNTETIPITVSNSLGRNLVAEKLTITTPNADWNVGKQPQLTLLAGGAQTIRIPVKVPAQTAPGNYKLWFSVPDGESTATGYITINVTAPVRPLTGVEK
ncbi:MAG: hypothetical protein Q4A82_06370 [Corynebacterium sp.]|nr:hypothetical protein [Corynebacterium sp.]